MNAPTVNKKRVGRQHPDYTQRPDNGVIWLHELVIDPKHPERIPAIKIRRAALWKNIKRGLFPEPVVGKTGWRLGAVRAWIRRRDALEVPTPDSAQSTAKLFSAAPLSTRGSNVNAVRRVPRLGATPVDVPVHDDGQIDADGQLALAQVKSCTPTDAAQTGSSGIVMVGEPGDVSLLLRSIFEGVTV